MVEVRKFSIWRNEALNWNCCDFTHKHTKSSQINSARSAKRKWWKDSFRFWQQMARLATAVCKQAHKKISGSLWSVTFESPFKNSFQKNHAMAVVVFHKTHLSLQHMFLRQISTIKSHDHGKRGYFGNYKVISYHLQSTRSAQPPGQLSL